MSSFFPEEIPLEDHRYERKFISIFPSKDIQQIIRINRGLFKEIYSFRTVNNIYFDTQTLDCFTQTVEGANERIKVRIRWYGEANGLITSPVLELKKKRGLLGTKTSFKLPSFNLDEKLGPARFNSLFQEAGLPDRLRAELANFNPVLLNSYGRRYFLSNDGKFRVTIDDNLSYNSLLSSFLPEKNLNHSVLELKYSFSAADDADSIANDLPFRVSKMSKYEDGVICLRDSARSQQ